MTKVVSQSLFPNKRCSISCPSVLAQKTAKYEKLFLFGYSYYLMQNSFSQPLFVYFLFSRFLFPLKTTV
ncbi:hypothetical protein B1155_03855 [Enterococcus faecium]|nr:hypothetical protein B1150_11205 [Enterococcus faecium]RCN75181.1 hypothetical protein B1155_03855 [Enterococcus faecium]